MARFLTTARTVGAIGATATVALTACSGVQSVLDARGPAADRIADLWWLLLAVASGVYVVFLTLLLGAIVRRRRDDGERQRGADPPHHRDARWVIAAAVVLPALVLAGVFVVTLRTQAALHAHAAEELTIKVVGRMWWWQITYVGSSLGDTVVGANEIHIPTGRRVRLELTSADVIHTLWVPNLQGKTDLVPARTLVTWVQAVRPGISRGQCAEFCGIQHAHMSFLVIAEPPAQFERWLAEQRRPASAPSDELGRQGQSVFLASGCGYCHSVRGIRTLGLLGPDLTHFAGRQTIAAGTLANAPGNLFAWIADPQRVKPGNKMPRVPLAPEQLRAVVAYVQSLR